VDSEVVIGRGTWGVAKGWLIGPVENWERQGAAKTFPVLANALLDMLGIDPHGRRRVRHLCAPELNLEYWYTFLRLYNVRQLSHIFFVQ